MFTNYLESLLIGFSIAAIPGPIFFELIRRTLSQGLKSGIALVIGEFVGNFLLLITIFFGVSSFLTTSTTSNILYFIGGMILLLISYSALKLKQSDVEASYDSNVGKNKSFISGLIIAVTSPIVIAFWVSISGSYLSDFSNRATAFVNIFFIALGFLIFFIPLAYITSRIRHKIPPKSVVILSRIFGSVLIIYGLILISNLIS